VDSLLQTQAQQVTQAQSDVQQARNTLMLIAGAEALTTLDELAKEKTSPTVGVDSQVTATP
jgi:outer membrane protein TolC